MDIDSRKMNELLQLEGIPVLSDEEKQEVVQHEKTILVPVVSNPSDRAKDIDADYTLARENLHHQSKMIKDMAEIALEIAKNSESVKMIDTFSILMNTLSNVNKDLIKIHKDMNDAVKQEQPKSGITDNSNGGTTPGMNINNATVFVGTPQDLLNAKGTSYDNQSAIKDIN
ncbi:erminase small subunit [Morganella phage vB_Mm5]